MIKNFIINYKLIVLVYFFLISPNVFTLSIAKSRYDSKAEYTRFVAEFDSEIYIWKEHNEVFEYKRFCIDVYNIATGHDAYEYLIKDGLVNKIKTEFFPQSNIQRFHIELNQRRPYKVWTMQNPHRLIIDVLRDGMVITNTKNQDIRSSSSTDDTAYIIPKTQRPYTDISQPDNKRIIIIDPGHGGKSIGASRHYKELGNIQEKDIVLQISLELKKLINKSASMNCYLTRNSDTDMSLDDRANFAKEKKGHLFISIHCNAVSDKTVRGIEFYYINQHGQQSQASSMLEAIENDKTDNKNNSKKSELELIFKGINDSRMKEYAAESKFLCKVINNVFSDYDYIGFTRYNRGVKHADFHVLRQAQPQAGILIEIGFISNLSEARKLVNKDFQNKIAQLIFESINNYWSKRDPQFDN